MDLPRGMLVEITTFVAVVYILIWLVVAILNWRVLRRLKRLSQERLEMFDVSPDFIRENSLRRGLWFWRFLLARRYETSGDRALTRECCALRISLVSLLILMVVLLALIVQTPPL